jgi:hypothetical protein
MAITATQIESSNSLEQFRQEFNNLQSDVSGLETGTLSFSTITTTSQNTTTLNVREDGVIIFEGATDDGFETTLTVVDPTADRVLTLPDETGSILTNNSVVNATTATVTANNSTDETVYLTFVDGATGSQGLETDTLLNYNPNSGILTSQFMIAYSSFLPDEDDGAGLGSTSRGFSDLYLASGGRIVADNDHYIGHISGTAGGFYMSNAGLSDSPHPTMVLQIRNHDNTITANEVLGSIQFTSSDPDGDSNPMVAAGIHAIAEESYTTSASATKLVFTTGDDGEDADQSATAKMTLNTDGDLTVAADITVGALFKMPDVTSTKILVADGTSFQEVAISGDATIANTGAVTLAAAAISGKTQITTVDITNDDLLILDATDGALKKVALTNLGFVTDDPTALAIALG